MPENNDFNRSLSRIFTNPVFKQIALSGTNPYFFQKLKKYDSLLSVESGTKVKDVIETAYRYLGRNYRNEYVYKNTIVNNILLGRHSIRTATMLNEFKVAGSIADTVILNGTSTVYEIKTELDTPDKLQKQLDDYRKVFAQIFLVTHYTLANKYLELVKNTAVGLLCLSDRFNLSVIKEAQEDYSFLNVDTMIRSLRKEEYSDIIKQYIGAIPDVPNTRFFTECLVIAREIDSKIFYEMMLHQLRQRTINPNADLELNETPKELKHICLCINPSEREYNNIHNFLNLNL